MVKNVGLGGDIVVMLRVGLFLLGKWKEGMIIGIFIFMYWLLLSMFLFMLWVVVVSIWVCVCVCVWVWVCIWVWVVVWCCICCCICGDSCCFIWSCCWGIDLFNVIRDWLVGCKVLLMLVGIFFVVVLVMRCCFDFGINGVVLIVEVIDFFDGINGVVFVLLIFVFWVGLFEFLLFVEERLGMKGCVFSKELLNVEESGVLIDILLEMVIGVILILVFWIRVVKFEVVWVLIDVWFDDILMMLFCVGEVDVRVVCEVIVVCFLLLGVILF